MLGSANTIAARDGARLRAGVERAWCYMNARWEILQQSSHSFCITSFTFQIRGKPLPAMLSNVSKISFASTSAVLFAIAFLVIILSFHLLFYCFISFYIIYCCCTFVVVIMWSFMFWLILIDCTCHFLQQFFPPQQQDTSLCLSTLYNVTEWIIAAYLLWLHTNSVQIVSSSFSSFMFPRWRHLNCTPACENCQGAATDWDL